MKDLQNATQQALTAKPNDEKIEALRNAFKIFSCNTQRLENAFDSLSGQFESLNLELQDANHNLQNKVAELDVITDYLTNILDNIAQGILFIDLNGTIMTCNKAAESILGIQSELVVHQRFGEVFKDEVFGFSMKKILTTKRETNTYYVNYSSPLNQHSDLEIVTTFALKNCKNGSAQNQGLIVMIRDITEVHYLQVTAARADRMKILGKIAAQVAHEIRNPLGGIKGFASLLKRDLAKQPELQKMASYIVEGTDTLNKLVDQILHYVRPVLLHLEKTNLMDLLEQIKQHVMADANLYRPEIEIVIEPAFDEVILPLDTGHFKSAILNLVVNAIQAMPKGGIIRFSLHKQTNHIVLSISDTGTGIPEELIPKLYSPFFTTKPDGNGLGLVEVQKVIQAHAGTIDVDSAPDKGTTFTIKLPLKYS